MTGLDITIPLFAIHHHKIGGTESAIYNLVHGLARTDAQLSVALADPARFSPEFQQWLGENAQIRQQRIPAVPGPKNTRFLEETLFELTRDRSNWVVYPNYFLPPRLLSSKSAVILHDIQYKVLPQYHSAKRKAWLDFYLTRLFKRADVVFLISQSEKNLVAEHFGAEAASRCRVVYNAIDWRRFEGAPATGRVAELVRRPYILTVSHPFPHKNLSTLLKAFNQIGQQDREIFLYLVGKESPDRLQLIQEHADPSVRDRIVLTGAVSDAELGEIYRNARLFVAPSLYEGFGMPAVEAMGHGAPTITSGTTSLPEVTLGKARYVADPLNADAWAAEIADALRVGGRLDPALVDEVRAAYDPAHVGRTMIEALRQVEGR